ncbi:MAG: response regulator [Cyanobacteria bacterium P01_F01_bin.143]
MHSNLYKAQELIYVLNSQLKKNTSGILTLETQVDSWQKQRKGILAIHNGALVYGGSTIPNNLQFVASLDSRISSNSMNTVLSHAFSKLKKPLSVRELTARLVKYQVFAWEKIEAQIHHQVVLILEKLISYPGQAKWNNSNSFDLCFGEDGHGLNWEQLKIDLRYRRIKWASLASKIDSMDAVPYVNESNLLKVKDSKVRKHLENNVDGHRTLLDIATSIGEDPLRIANFYFNWVNSEIVSFEKISEANSTAETVAMNREVTNVPTILSVDDSPIVQTCIKRALKGCYEVLCTSRPFKALTILNQKSIDLILLDLNMPEMNGLEFCKKIRKTPKLKNLPIIMVTARDGMVNKMKGQMAGSNAYITKPFKSQELMDVVATQLS